jgi:site-specific DNA-methyltransferase (cytosine-N4-specific)
MEQLFGNDCLFAKMGNMHKMSDSNLAIVMVDRADIESIIKTPSFIIHVLNREAKHAMQLKKIEI